MGKNKKIPRDEVREYILKVAKEIFMEKGYLKTSIRDIASKGGLSLGRIYVYFKKKEDIFMAIIKPVIDIIDTMTFEEDIKDNIENERMQVIFSRKKFYDNLKESANVVKSYRDELELAFFKSDGFDKCDMREIIINSYMKNHSVVEKILYKKGIIGDIKRGHRAVNTIAKLYLSVYEELVLSNMNEEEYDIYIKDMSNFIYYGNLRALSKIGNLDIDVLKQN